MLEEFEAHTDYFVFTDNLMKNEKYTQVKISNSTF